MPDESNPYDRDALIESLKRETLPGCQKNRYEMLLDDAGGDDEKLDEGLRSHAIGRGLTEMVRSLPDPPMEKEPVWAISNELADMCGMSRKDFLKLARKVDLPAYTWRTGEGLIKVSLRELRQLYSDRTIVCFDMHDVIQFEREHPDWLQKKTKAGLEKEATGKAIVDFADHLRKKDPRMSLEELSEKTQKALRPRVRNRDMALSGIRRIITTALFPHRQKGSGGRPRKAKDSQQ